MIEFFRVFSGNGTDLPAGARNSYRDMVYISTLRLEESTNAWGPWDICDIVG